MVKSEEWESVSEKGCGSMVLVWKLDGLPETYMTNREDYILFGDLL